jgi:hypothetical protein
VAGRFARQVRRGPWTAVRDAHRERDLNALDEARFDDIVAHIGDFPEDPVERERFNTELRAGKFGRG